MKYRYAPRAGVKWFVGMTVLSVSRVTPVCFWLVLLPCSSFWLVSFSSLLTLGARYVRKDLLEMITLFGRRDELTVPFRTGKWSVDHGLCHRFQYRS